jgi:hypothetical protein
VFKPSNLACAARAVLRDWGGFLGNTGADLAIWGRSEISVFPVYVELSAVAPSDD